MEASEIIGEIVSQSQGCLAPNMSERYRCMVVWDTRENRDVGWIMVKKNGSEMLKSDEVERMMAKCQWRTCNLKKLKENASVGNSDCGDTSGSREVEKKQCIEEDEAVEDKMHNSDEASTSTEATRNISAFTMQIEQPGKVDCAVQVGEVPPDDIHEATIDKFKIPLLENDCELFSNVDNNMLENVVINESDEGIVNEISSDPKSGKKVKQVAFSSKRKKLKKPRKSGSRRLLLRGAKRIKGAKEELLNLADSPAPTRSSPRIRGTPGVARLADWCICQECGKRIRKKSLYSHLLSVHSIRSVLTTCNACGRSVSEVNLISHREKCRVKTCSLDKWKEGPSGSNDSSGEGKESEGFEHVRNKKGQGSISSPEEAKEELVLNKQIQQLAKVIDMFENGVEDTVSANANNNNDVTKGIVSIEKNVAASSRKKKLKKRLKSKLKGSKDGVLGKGNLIKPHAADIPIVTRSLRRRPCVTGLADWCACPECGKRIRLKSLNSHLSVVHNIRSVLVTCNMCGRSVSEANLLNHRRTSHPEMFITCSGCNLELSCLEFDNHECAASDELKDNLVGKAKEKKTENKVNQPSKMREEWFVRKTVKDPSGNSCPECHVFFAIDDIKPHECEKKVSVKIKKLKISDSKPAAGALKSMVLCLDEGNLESEDCGESTENLEELSKQRCHPVAKVKLVEKTTEKEGNLKVNLGSALVTEQPPQMIKRGDVFNFSVRLVSSGLNSLHVQAVSTISCRGSCEVELLQADGSTTMQQLLVSICSMTNGGLQRCLVPSQLICRQVSRDTLQFSLSCDQYCGSKDNKFKMVVATKQAVLCYSREMFVGAAPKMSDYILPQPVFTKPVSNEKVMDSQKLVASGEEDGGCGGYSEGDIISDEWVWDVI